MPARPLRRFGAYAIDYLVLAAYIVALTWVAFTFAGAERLESWTADRVRGQLIALVAVTLPVAGYFAVCEAAPWQGTVGKRLLGLRVVDEDGARPAPARTVVRALVKFAPWELAHTAVWRVENWPHGDPGPEVFVLSGAAMVLASLYAFAIVAGRPPLYDTLAGTTVVSA